MFKSSFICLLSILILGSVYSSEYKTLYLMEFENSSKDHRTDYLRKQLPELVNYNFSNLDFKISYAPNFINTPDEYKTNSLLDGYLLYGKYATYKENVIVSFDVYDVMSWDKITSRTYRCNLDDIECIQKAFIVCIEEDVLSLFCDYYDCMGVCDGQSKQDCSGECNGSAKLDCNGYCNGTSYIDRCGNCVLSEDINCQMDCNGEWGEGAYLNECGLCVEGNTGLVIDSGKDCFGTCGGNAVLDCNDECNGSTITDCNEDCNGSAFFNECNVCVGGLTENELNLGFDCNGECFGAAIIDDCGICGGDNSSCSDCNGESYGKAKQDNCGICDANPSNDCKQDCNNDWGGTALVNDCLVCVAGNTDLSIDTGKDCLEVCWGNSKIDECGVCNGLGAIYKCGCEEIPEGFCDCSGNINDCFDQCGGGALVDDCGICGGDGENCKDKTKPERVIKKIPIETSETNISLSDMLSQENIESNNQTIYCDNCDDINTGVKLIGDFNDFINSDEKQENTDKFLYIVDDFFKSPYNVFVKDINIEKDTYNNKFKVTVPVSYSIKRDLFETLFSNLPHKKIMNQNGTMTIELSKSNFYIERGLENYFAIMKYQVVPVIFFANSSSEVTHIHVDSWKDNYDFFALSLSKDINITNSSSFYPLFSITPGENSIQINFDLSDLNSTYEFEVESLSDISNLSVNIMYENELQKNINSYASE